MPLVRPRTGRPTDPDHYLPPRRLKIPLCHGVSNDLSKGSDLFRADALHRDFGALRDVLITYSNISAIFISPPS
jgi:hypothetical protein